MNEHLGIVDEARRKVEFYTAQSANLRRRILGEPAPSVESPTQPAADPHQSYRLRMPRKSPYWQRAKAESKTRRRVFDAPDNLDVNPLQIVQAVSRISHVTMGDLCGPAQGKQVARPRQVAIYFIGRCCRDLSLGQIAYIFDRHHTTMLHAMLAVRTRLAKRHDWTCGMVSKVEAVLRSLS